MVCCYFETMEKRRVTIKLKNPNPLFERWLVQWRDLERQRNSKKEHCYTNALKSLKKYPLPLKTGRDCIILQGFGQKLCKMLDDKLVTYKANGEDASHRSTEVVSQASSIVNDVANSFADNVKNGSSPSKVMVTVGDGKRKKVNHTPTGKGKKVKETAEYSPAYRSGAYALLLALYKDSLEPDYKGFLLKQELISAAQQYCGTSFIKPTPGSHYTAWSSMSGLITKGLVNREGNPAKFNLADPGVILGHKLFKSHQTKAKLFIEGIDCRSEETIEVLDEDIIVNTDDRTADMLAQVIAGEHNKLDRINLLPQEISSKSKTLDSDSYKQEMMPQEIGKRGAKNKAQASHGIKPKVKKNLISKHPSNSSIETCSSVADESFILAPNTFDIYLLVDTQETAGAAMKSYDMIIQELNHLNVQYEVRNLKVGDYTWVCRERGGSKELLLPYIVERKRLDDFGSSIKDGRFHEQKFRLKQSGVQNLVYLVESYDTKHTGLPLNTLFQAATNTLIQDGFSVKFTKDLNATVQYLATFSKIIDRMFKTKTLVSCPKINLMQFAVSDDLVSLMTFKEFNQNASKHKSFKVQEFFIKQLLQLKGVSVDKALAIVEAYPTPRLLHQKYCTCDAKEGESLLSNVQFGKLRKKVGPVISKSVFQLYTLTKY